MHKFGPAKEIMMKYTSCLNAGIRCICSIPSPDGEANYRCRINAMSTVTKATIHERSRPTGDYLLRFGSMSGTIGSLIAKTVTFAQ